MFSDHLHPTQETYGHEANNLRIKTACHYYDVNHNYDIYV